MATTLTELKSMMEDNGTDRIFTDTTETLLFPFCHDGTMLQVVAELYDEGRYLRFRIPWLLDLSEVSPIEIVLGRLLLLNSSLKMLKFSYDSGQGEVSASIEIALEDAHLTEQQVHRFMYVLCNVATKERDRLLTLISSGVYPASTDPRFTDVVSRLVDAPNAPVSVRNDFSNTAANESTSMNSGAE